MWEISNNNQIITFVLSIALGGVFCLLYDVVRAIRKVGLNSTFAVNVSDILIWVVFAFATFIFLMARTNGEIRGYVLCGELLGFVLMRISISKVLYKLLLVIFLKITSVKRKIDRCFYTFVIKVEKRLLKELKYVPKIFKSIKKFLKNTVKMLYNKTNIVD